MKRVLIGVSIVALLIMMIGFSYAYVNNSVTGNGKDKIVETGTLSLVYIDGNELRFESTKYNDYVSKVFTVTNNGTLTVDYSINLSELINTNGRNELILKATCKSYDSKTNTIKDYCMDINDVPIVNSSKITDSIIKEGISIKPGITHEYTVTITYTGASGFRNYSQEKKFSSNINIAQSDESNLLVSKMLKHNNVLSDENVVFSRASEVSGDKGLYYTSDVSYTQNGKEVIYYRGAVENNYVIFGEYNTDRQVYYSPTTMLDYEKKKACESEATDCEIYTYHKAGDKMCWRIVRTNEDGSIKLRYAGATVNGKCQRTGSDVRIGVSNFNDKHDDLAYTGYMYPSTPTKSSISDMDNDTVNAKSSKIKLYLERWYADNLLSLESYIADTIYCADRTISSGSMYYGLQNMGPQYDFGKNTIWYGALERFVEESNNESWIIKNNAHPEYKCKRLEDSFTTIGATFGNKKLSYPIGLLTLDELSYAGGVWLDSSNMSKSTNKTYYLYTSKGYWTMTPSSYFSDSGYVFRVNNDGYFDHNSVNDSINGNIIPSISLKYNVKSSRGIGTYDDPYVISGI